MRYFAATMSLRIILLLGVVVSASGCLGDGIEYRITGSIGGPGGYLYIGASGEMTRVIGDDAKDMRVLDAMVMEDLWQRVDDAEFATLAPSYPDGCCADQVAFYIEVQRSGTFYAVNATFGGDFPERLLPLVGALQTLLDCDMVDD